MASKEVCELCSNIITSPVCTDCYIKHATSWLWDFGLTKTQIKEVVEELRKKLPGDTLNENSCVLCEKEKVAICMYCAFLEISGIASRKKSLIKQESFWERNNFKIEINNAEYLR